MSQGLLLFCLCVSLLVVRSNCEAQLYQWVDEKGTLHFSESPPPEKVKNLDKKQDQIKDKGVVRDKTKGEDKKTISNYTVRNQEQSRSAKEDSISILKRLEVGNRPIPDDMKKYGPASPEGPSRRDQAGDSQPSVRRSSS